MRTIVALSLTVISCLSTDAHAECVGEITQGDMNECAASAAQSADAELNEVYQEVLRRYASDRSFIAALRDAQRAWIAYRDAEVVAVFPESDKRSAYGS